MPIAIACQIREASRSRTLSSCPEIAETIDSSSKLSAKRSSREVVQGCLLAGLLHAAILSRSSTRVMDLKLPSPAIHCQRENPLSCAFRSGDNQIGSSDGMLAAERNFQSFKNGSILSGDSSLSMPGPVRG